MKLIFKLEINNIHIYVSLIDKMWLITMNDDHESDSSSL